MRILQLMEYSHLLNLADECEDPYMKMVYACKYRTPGIVLSSVTIRVLISQYLMILRTSRLR